MPSELTTSPLAPLLLKAYRFQRLRGRIRNLCMQLENGQNRSATLRAIFRQFHDIEAGAYSYGGFFNLGHFPGGARVGRYVSMSDTAVRRLDHPADRLTTHPFFYNPRLGVVAERTVAHEPIEIGADAWISHGVIFTERCTRVGIGAVIGAGAVVTRNVADFEVVAGVPARRLRQRFPDAVCARVLESRWWERSLDELMPYAESLLLPVEKLPAGHPLLLPKAR